MSALETVSILERLAAFPTVSRDTNLPLIDWVRNFLADQGVDSHLVRDDTGRKSNLFASIGPLEEGGVVLSGHTDVVPVDGQGWASDPFALSSRGTRLYARGACDMKGFIAAVLSRVPVWQAAKLARPVHLMLSYDEEVGCLGAPSLIAAAREALPEPAAVIVGEPTNMRLATSHKGICGLQTRVTGVEAHSSLTHQGVSAVMLAAEVIAHLGTIASQIAGTEASAMARRFEPPYTTLSVNRISGGTAANILAATCEFVWDIRSLPGDSPDLILEQLASFVEGRLRELAKEGKRCAIETIVRANAPALRGEGGCFAERLVACVLGSEHEPIAVPFATEGGQFQEAGWSTVVCGPGSIEQAHKPDEFVERSELVACEEFLERVVGRQCG